MHIPLAFELDHEELRQIEALSNDFENGLLDGLLDKTTEADKIFDSFSAIFREKSSAIRRRARKRSLAYYAEHHEELINALKDEITSLCLSRAYREKGEEFMFTTEKCPDRITRLLSPYLEIMNETERQDILNFIDYTVRNRDKIYREINKPAVSTEAVRPKKYIAPNTKASNRAFGRNNAPFYEGAKPLSVEGRKSKKQIDVYMSIRYDSSQDIGIKLCGAYQGRTLIPFDRIVHDAIVTLYIDGGNENITNHMIFQVISGNEAPASEKGMSPEWDRRINESIDRMFHSVIEIDATEQAKVYGFEELHYKGHVLNCSIITAKINGQITKCVHVCETPALYRYADNCGQVIRTDLRMLNIPDFINTPENAILKNYLLQQIRVMQYSPRYSRTISFETLYDLLDINAESEGALRKKKKQIRDKTKICLDYWKAEGFITGYEENKKGKNIVSITLFVPDMSKSPKKPVIQRK